VRSRSFFDRQTVDQSSDYSRRVSSALRLWNEAGEPRGTVIESYLAGREVALSDSIANHVIRHHEDLKLDGCRTVGMVALMRDIVTNQPRAVQRTFLDPNGRKICRKMLGPARGTAVKLSDDANVTFGLFIGEGIETCIAALAAGFSPCWALGSAGAIGDFPVLTGIDAIAILGECDDNGANARAAESCAARWNEAGREVAVIEPLVGDDMNAIWQQVASHDG
jgi:hypothetical protein